MKGGALSASAELYAALDALRAGLGFVSDAPVDPFAMASRLGCQVALHALSGAIGGTQYGSLILLNSARPPEARRFSLAHELVHYTLHPEPGARDARLEWQANAGAAELLMPWRRFVPYLAVRRSLLASSPERLFAEAAAEYGVSYTQAQLRVTETRYALRRYADGAPLDAETLFP